MGNSVSNVPPEHACLDDFLNELTIQFPGVELELENAYKALTGCDEIDTIQDTMGDYQSVEPVIRHFLFTMGLGDYIGRFVDSQNRLKLSEIVPLLAAVGIRFDPHAKLNLDDWKILLVAWVRRVEEEQRNDLDIWHKHLQELQKEQEVRREAALSAFKRSYLDQMQVYHKSVEDHYRQEQEYRRQWEEHQAMQDRFKEAQTQYLATMNEDARRNLKQRILAAQQQNVIQLLDKETKAMQREAMEGADRVTAFIYPVTLNEQTGAPVSGGAYIPHHRGKLV